MKKLYLTCLLCLITGFVFETAAQTYVNHAATGMNTGTDWDNAYTDLQNALANASEGDEIWVAEGTYLPGDNPEAVFLIDVNLRLYGGFTGTEASIKERGAPLAHPTILSGDLNGDDVPNNFTSFRSDNVMTVVAIHSHITNEAFIDGFIIRNGHADGMADNQERFGGGIYCEGSPSIRYCRFEQNYAFWGGAVYVTGLGAQGITVEDCHFVSNQTVPSGAGRGGGLAAEGVSGDGVRVFQSTFDDNWGGWAGGVHLNDSNGLFDEVSFTNNSTPRQGGALRLFTSDNYTDASLTILNSSFEQNTAAFGGGFCTELHGNSPEIIVSNTSFDDNTTAPVLQNWDSGGGGFCISADSQEATFSIDSCYFHSNSSQGHGAALEIFPIAFSTVNINVTNSTFTENENVGNYNYGAATIWYAHSSSGQVNIANCLFESNTSIYAAGLDLGSFRLGGPVDFYVQGCRFINNHASAHGGALHMWGDVGSSPSFIVEGCVMENNTAGQHAGAIWVNTSSSGYNAVVNHCRITNNHCPTGGVIDAYQFDLESFTLPEGASFYLNNSLLAGNTGDAAAISLKSFPGFQMQNATIAGNESNGLLLQGQSTFFLQNTILYNPGFTELGSLAGKSTVISKGGNIIGDNSLAGWLNNTDQSATDPLLGGDYLPGQNSPAIDAGLAYEGMAEFDLAGNGRLQGSCIDIGALESSYDANTECQIVVSTREILADNPSLTLYPNPATSFLSVGLPEGAPNTFQLQLLDTQGRLVYQQMTTSDEVVNLEGLARGLYLVKAVAEGKFYTGRFVKQ